jgi:hypothetical protein
MTNFGMGDFRLLLWSSPDSIATTCPRTVGLIEMMRRSFNRMFRSQERKGKILFGSSDVVLTAAAFELAYGFRRWLPLSNEFFLLPEVKDLQFKARRQQERVRGIAVPRSQSFQSGARISGRTPNSTTVMAAAPAHD